MALLKPSAIRFISSIGNEVVFFDSPILLAGKAEDYLFSLLNAQMQVLSKSLLQSITRFSTIPRKQWLLQRYDTPDERVLDPSQICLLVNQIVFSKQTEAALSKPSKAEKTNLQLLSDLIRSQLADLIAMTSLSLSKDDRQRLMCMITMDAHNRDIIDTMVKEKVSKTSDFAWQSKMRAYFVPNAEASKENLKATAKLQICDASFDYGFEYLGNGSKLVVTPLTDRVYVTAAQALHLKMGCAPAGPAVRFQPNLSHQA
jgi:dynein heavy chain, axonemal